MISSFKYFRTVKQKIKFVCLVFGRIHGTLNCLQSYLTFKLQILSNGFHETLCLSLSRRKKYWHIYCCFVIMLKLWSLKMCYAVWSFMIYLQLPFILFLHFHDLFKREEFIINKLKKSNTKIPGEKNLLSKCPVCYWEKNISKHIEYP